MVYLKTILLIAITMTLLVSGIFISYHDVQYWNVLYIVFPILLIAGIYFFFELTIQKRIDFNFYNIRFNYLVSLILLLAAVAITLVNFDFSSLLEGNYAEIRAIYLDKLAEQDVSILEQLVPLLTIYPLAHLFSIVANKEGINWKMIILIVGLLFIGQKSGGRQIIFQLFVVIMVIKKGRIFPKTYQSLLFVFFFVLLASIVTIGRFNNLDVSKAQLLEGITPAQVSPVLKEKSNYPALQELGIEVAFYFGQSLPAFCNEIGNVDIKILPTYVWGMQPFLERQLGKVGLVSVPQVERYDRYLALSDDSGFFPGTWGTGFLDLYFNIGLLGTFSFCLAVAFLLFTSEKNLQYTGTSKFKVLRGYNVLFMITMFMAPAFFDTAIIFSYLLILFNKSDE